MDVVAIEEAIEELENSETTVDNIKELSALYICRDHLMLSNHDAVESELEDIFPYYRKYRDIKRRYQLRQTNESEVAEGIKAVCRELTEFVETLYSGTDMNKERICIRKMLEKLYNKYK